MVISRGRNGGEHFPQPYLQPLSHTASSPSSLPASASPDSLKAGVKGCRGVHCVKIHQQSRAFQESPQYCCKSKQNPKTYLPPNISQGGIKKSWNGKKGPGGRRPWMAVTFAGLISQDQNPLSCCQGPFHPWLLPGNPKWLGGWDGCQPHC